MHGGPGLQCFELPLYDALTKGVMQTTINLEDGYDAKTVYEAQNLISEGNLETVLELAGTFQILRTDIKNGH